MSTKTIGYGLIVIGILVIVVGIFADVLGFGSGSHQLVLSQIGWHQWLLAAVGLIIAVVGGFFAMQRK